ncbi:tripartite tricarboxylate transporter substrate-binding protein [Cupriavidus gilardii]|uniref:tripartite tricarboxylate transporter substrate-binding protein n=1 Tax=Cupriavidus gilardii TaxID=82541 RepID=UPI0021C23217|nr:tripartite tricarboxylate transporter substrate-binding protein [Cupriavidus gilardii]MCT9117884.1 tripartite tricarboxylate transporter substrate-binding protein [Cupriavidus gilardii]
MPDRRQDRAIPPSQAASLSLARRFPAKVHAAIQKALADPALRQQLLDRGAEPVPQSSAAFAQFVRAEYERWGTLVKRSGASVD